MARNNLSSLIRLDDAFAESPRFSRLLMYGSILILFALTFYGAWLFTWSWVVAVLVALSSTLLLFYLQYKAILVKSENRFVKLPFVHMVFFLIPLSCMSFFSLHGLTLHFNFQDDIEAEMECKASSLTDMISDFDQFYENEMNRVFETYNDAIDNNTPLPCQPFNLTDDKVQYLKNKSSDERLERFERQVKNPIDQKINDLRKDLSTEPVQNHLTSDYDWSTIVTTLKSYDVEFDKMMKLQQTVSSIINDSSTCSSLSSNPDAFFYMKSITRHWDVSKRGKNWQLMMLLGVLLLCTILPIMTSDPSSRDY